MKWGVLACACLLLAACGGGPDDDGASPTTTATATAGPTPTGTPTSPVPSDGTATPSPGVPEPATLAGFLATPADLGADWTLWEGFAEWPGGAPGVIPDGARADLPVFRLCPNAGEAAVALAEGLQWEAFTQLHLTTPDPFATMVVAQQFLLADEPAAVEETFLVLRDGATACLTENLPEGEWEIGRRQALTVPAVGDDRYGDRSSSVDIGGARRETRWILVRDGAVLMAIQLDDILISADAEPVLTDASVDAVVTAMAEKLT